MSFTDKDVEQVLNILHECGDCELHVEIGDLKVSVAKGDRTFRLEQEKTSKEETSC